MKRFLSGNEAVAQGAWEAGVRVASGYPGTPSTEILEAFAAMKGVYAEWSPNEKVALDVGIGAAYAGSRAMVTMKHVGLNVASDSLFYAAMTGIEAGLVVVCADDPGMHSSQGEQDSRRYAKFARVPCLEPSSSQEAKEMVGLALELSERHDTPVLLRVTTRIAHSHGIVELTPEARPPERSGPASYKVNVSKYVMLPSQARNRRPLMEARIRALAEQGNSLACNRVEMGSAHLGIVTHGVAYQYAKEVFPAASFLRLGMTYPIPGKLLFDFARRVARLVVIEELDPVIEEELKLLGVACEGKSIFPSIGELSTEVVRDSAMEAGLLPGEIKTPRLLLDIPPLPPRPPVLCPGCPHRAVFAVARKLKVVVNGDIGCYTLGSAQPLNALHTVGCMGGGIGVAHGANRSGLRQKNVAVIGDSTFLHAGIPALLNVAYNQSDTLTLILDNRTTAMTGQQDHPGTGVTLQGAATVNIEFEPLVRALGISQVCTVDPYNLEELEKAFKSYLKLKGPAVIVARRECSLLPEVKESYQPLRVDSEKCTACSICLRLGCPALARSDELLGSAGHEHPKARIDASLCMGCELCAQSCPDEAISFRKRPSEGGST